ncbi:MAG: aminotransferase class III-fold pyridoxal phosphate-dependent enzyme [Kineosporiaceae bacterium]|nr:aminotransferase class III-fold pyridoxal phosphate-dependent enzyme [Kineosporiaceae bacterium]MBK8077014.1 aminotransferase class III-fold pyridoxal phosphate-dependent enzyme [Kineosporiaceae bacterium]
MAHSASSPTAAVIDRARLTTLIDAERATYAASNPRSAELFASAGHLFGRVPMTWMNKWSGGFPLYLDRAEGNRLTDVDGHTYIDFALGDTGAMAGHSPAATIAAVHRRLAEQGGITTMLPTEDAEWVGAELARRFGLPLWSFTLSATDANRWAVRLARLATGRNKILVFSYCYHGSVDEIFAVPGPDGRAVARPGNVAPPVPLHETTRVVEFNDAEALARELAHGDVAAVLMEPALTNIGIVLPEPGFLDRVHELCQATGTLLMIDETHTFSAGAGGATAAWGLHPDIFVIGKSIGGGIPSGAYGITREVAERIGAHRDADLVDVGGVGGTLAGNALSLAAMRATLGHVLTEQAFEHMIELATAFTEGVQATLDATGVAWSVSQLGARSEYRFASPAPRTGTESAAGADDELDEFLHLFMINRGVLITPFHNMALMCPVTTAADVERHTQLFAEAVAILLG